MLGKGMRWVWGPLPGRRWRDCPRARPTAVLSPGGALCTRFTACVSLSVYVWGCAPHPGAWDSCKRSVATHFEARTGRRTRQNEPPVAQ